MGPVAVDACTFGDLALRGMRGPFPLARARFSGCTFATPRRMQRRGGQLDRLAGKGQGSPGGVGKVSGQGPTGCRPLSCSQKMCHSADAPGAGVAYRGTGGRSITSPQGASGRRITRPRRLTYASGAAFALPMLHGLVFVQCPFSPRRCPKPCRQGRSSRKLRRPLYLCILGYVA